LHNEVMLKFMYWSLALTLVIQACYEYFRLLNDLYCVGWGVKLLFTHSLLRVPLNMGKSAAYCQGNVSNFAVSGQWSPLTLHIE